MTILIVDDTVANRTLLRLRLEAEGHTVLEADDGGKALDLLMEREIDAIISDILMPRVDGYKLCYEIRKSDRFHTVPLIMTSPSYFSPEDETFAFELGVDLLVKKPFQFSAISDVLREVEKNEKYRQPRLLKQPQELEVVRQYSERLVIKLEEKNAELETAHNQLKYLFDSLDEVFFSFDPVNRVLLQISPASEEIYGYTQEDFLKNPRLWFDVIHPEDRSRVDALTTGEPRAALRHWECRIIRRDGGIKWIDTRVKSTIDASGAVIRLDGIVSDISLRRASDQELRLQTMYFQQLFDNSPAGIVLLDRSGRILKANNAFEEMFLYPRCELAGSSINVLLAPPGGLEEGLGLPPETTKGSVIQEDARRKRKDDTIIDVSIIGYPVIIDNVTAGRYEIYVDISESKKLEAQLLRVQRLESIGTLASGVAHDLNNVLAPIALGVYSLRRKFPQPSARKMLDLMESCALRGAGIVKQVLTFAQGAEGERTVLQPRYLLKEVEEIMRATFPKSIRVASQLAKDLRTVSGNSTELHQVLLNLCVNARDAMPSGGRITLEAENAEIDEQYSRMHAEARPGSYVIFSVADTGRGITPEILGKIFDPFFTTKSKGKGTGLGLSTVLGIVKSHGGFVNVYTELGKGSRFTVYLPVAASSAPAEPHQDEALRPGNGEAILVVDDELSICEITRSTLEACNYKVLVAHDGTEAISLYLQHRKEIKLVLTDMSMPFMDGKATILALRKIDPGVKIISSSGLAENIEPMDSDNHTVDASLLKPYSAEKLLRTVSRVLTPVPVPA